MSAFFGWNNHFWKQGLEALGLVLTALGPEGAVADVAIDIGETALSTAVAADTAAVFGTAAADDEVDVIVGNADHPAAGNQSPVASPPRRRS